MTNNNIERHISEHTNSTLSSYENVLVHDENILTFYSSAYGMLVLFNIMKSYYDKKSITQEDILNKINPTFGSRNSILNLLRNAERKKLIIRTILKKDKRSKAITPSPALIKSYIKITSSVLNK